MSLMCDTKISFCGIAHCAARMESASMNEFTNSIALNMDVEDQYTSENDVEAEEEPSGKFSLLNM